MSESPSNLPLKRAQNTERRLEQCDKRREREKLFYCVTLQLFYLLVGLPHVVGDVPDADESVGGQRDEDEDVVLAQGAVEHSLEKKHWFLESRYVIM